MYTFWNIDSALCAHHPERFDEVVGMAGTAKDWGKPPAVEIDWNPNESRSYIHTHKVIPCSESRVLHEITSQVKANRMRLATLVAAISKALFLRPVMLCRLSSATEISYGTSCVGFRGANHQIRERTGLSYLANSDRV